MIAQHELWGALRIGAGPWPAVGPLALADWQGVTTILESGSGSRGDPHADQGVLLRCGGRSTVVK